MRRRTVRVLIAIIAFNLIAMTAMFVDMRSEDSCDTAARGLIIWIDERERWQQVAAPDEQTDLPPCKGRLETELTVLPG